MDDPGDASLGPLDYVYAPSTDVAADVRWLTEALGAEIAFAIDSDGTRVAMLRMGAGGPPVLVADHLHDQRPIFLYRVASLEAARRRLEQRGLGGGHAVDLPPGLLASSTPRAACASASTSRSGSRSSSRGSGTAISDASRRRPVRIPSHFVIGRP